MRRKLFIYGIIASIIAVLLTSMTAFVIIQNSSVEETELSAKHMAFILLVGLEQADESTYDEKAKLLKYAESFGEQTPYRITIISKDGVVLGDSNADIMNMDNHADRSEVLQASQSGMGSARRYSETLNTSMMYVAVKSSNSGLIVRVALPLTELRKRSISLLVGCLISLFVGVFVSLVASWFFSKRLSRPIRTLANAIKNLAEGSMQSDVILNSRTELDDLAHDFNEMSKRLNTSLSKLRHKNSEFDAVLSSMEDGLIAIDRNQNILYVNPACATLFNISENIEQGENHLSSVVYQKDILDAAEKCIRQNGKQSLVQKLGLSDAMDYSILVYPMFYKNEISGAIMQFRDITHVLELERLRSDFVANVSHELRTPLTSIKGYAEALRDEELLSNEDSKRFLDIIEIEADRLNNLINDLMELSKIENRGLDTDISLHDFNEIADETAAIVSLGAKQKGVKINLNLQEEIKILANRDRIKQLLLNLMDNGIKYNKTGGELSVEAKKNNGMLRLVIKDTGVGMDKEDLPRLFERFYRVDKSRSKELGGTGLGLSIVKHIAELYGGSVTVDSIKGQGSEFVVTLPILV